MRSILVVDDQAAIRRLIALVLEHEGFPVHTAACGADAVRISDSRRGEFGLLITDIVMPEMDGRALAAELRTQDPDLPVLYISGDFEPGEFQPGPGCDFLPKPFTIDALLLRVRGLLEARECPVSFV